MYALLLELPLVAGLHRLITEVQAPHRHAATPMTTIVAAIVHILLQYVHPVAPVLLPASLQAVAHVPVTPVVVAVVIGEAAIAEMHIPIDVLMVRAVLHMPETEYRLPLPAVLLL